MYIDNGLVTGNNDASVNALLQALVNEFDITHADPEIHLGLQIKNGQNDSIFLHQTACTKIIIKRMNMEEATTLCIPADPNEELHPDFHVGEQTKLTKAPYREAIGSILYLSKGTRSDIAHAISKAS